ncbi:hypothetical protein PCE1_001770 [Barthelona sp. PCE]
MSPDVFVGTGMANSQTHDRLQTTFAPDKLASLSKEEVVRKLVDQADALEKLQRKLEIQNSVDINEPLYQQNAQLKNTLSETRNAVDELRNQNHYEELRHESDLEYLHKQLELKSQKNDNIYRNYIDLLTTRKPIQENETSKLINTQDKDFVIDGLRAEQVTTRHILMEKEKEIQGLQSTITDLKLQQNEVQITQERNSMHLKRKVETLQTQVQDLQRDLRAARAQVHESDSTRVDHRQTVGILKETLAAEQISKQDMLNRLEASLKSNALLKERIQEMNREREIIERDSEPKEEDLLKKADIDRMLATQRIEHETSRQTLKKRNFMLEKQIKDLLEEMEVLRDNVEAGKHEEKRIQHELVMIRSQHEGEMKALVKSSEQQYNDVRNHCDSLLQEMTNWKERYEDMVASRTELEDGFREKLKIVSTKWKEQNESTANKMLKLGAKVDYERKRKMYYKEELRLWHRRHKSLKNCYVNLVEQLRMSDYPLTFDDPLQVADANSECVSTDMFSQSHVSHVSNQDMH